MIDAGPKFYVVWSPNPYMTLKSRSNFCIEVFTMSVFVKPLMDWFIFGMVIETGLKFYMVPFPTQKVTDSEFFYNSFVINVLQFQFLAHLSRRLKRWAYSIPMIRRPSVVVVGPSVVVHTYKLEYLWSQLANLDQILCVASLGWGKGCIRFGGRLDENSGFYDNRKPPLTYNGEKRCLHLFSVVLYLIFFILADNEDMHKISDEFEFRPDWATDYRVSCPWVSKQFPIDL